MKTPFVVTIIVGAHCVAAAGIVLMQGCGTPMAVTGEPGAMVMPPTRVVEALPPVRPMPTRLATPSRPAKSWPAATTVYVVGKGECLSLIAKKYALGVNEIAALNDLPPPYLIRSGQRLVLPGTIDLDSPVVSAPAARPAAAGSDAYVVKAGDTLSGIAVRHGTTVAALREANRLTGDLIRVGDKLVVKGGSARTASVGAAPSRPAPSRPAPPRAVGSVAPPVLEIPTVDEMPPEPVADIPDEASPPSPVVEDGAMRVHEVDEGEDLYSVSLMWGVPVSEIKRVNGLTDTEVTPGQKLKIPMTE